MPTAIQFLRSSTASLRPNPVDLSDGMPMVQLNESDPGLFFKLRNNSLCKVGPCSVGTTAPNSNPVLQAGNTIGETWLDTTTAGSEEFKVWSGSAWITVATAGVSTLQAVSDAGAVTTNTLTVAGLISAGDISLSGLIDAANDAAAATAGVAVNQLYRNGSVVQIRVA